MRVPPPIPCAISASRSTARRDVALAQAVGDMDEAGVEHEGLGLAEGVDHAVQEAHEERGVEAHRARGVEQHHQAQRLRLAPAPDEIDRRAAMGDAAMDGAAQIEPAAAPPRPLAPHQARPHARARRAASACARGDLVGIDDVADVGRPPGSRRATRPRAGRARRRLSPSSPRRSTWSGRPGVRLRRGRCGRRRGGPAAAGRAAAASARGARRGPARRRRRSRRSAPSPSAWRRTARCSAGCEVDGPRAGGRGQDRERIAASPRGRRQSRCRASVRTKPASRRRIASPIVRRRCRQRPAWLASRHLAEQAVDHLAARGARGPRGS